MADKRAKKGGMNYCAAGGPNKVNCANRTGTPGISMHYFPKDESLRQSWTRFVRIHRKDFAPKKSSCLCSAHFDDSCFEHKPLLADGSGKATEIKRILKKGSVPSKNADVPSTSPLTERKRRRVIREVMHDAPTKKRKSSATPTATATTATATLVETGSAPLEQGTPSATSCATFSTPLSSRYSTPCSSVISGPASSENDDFALHASPEITPTGTPPTLPFPDSVTPLQPQSTGNLSCKNCKAHAKKRRNLQKKHNRLQKNFNRLEKKLEDLQNALDSETEVDEEEFSVDVEEEEEVQEDLKVEGEDTDWAASEDSAPSAEDYSSQSEEELDGIDSSNTVRVEPGTSCYEEPKFIVFFTQLLGIFSLFCFKCKGEKPKVTMKQRGTMVTVRQHCYSCGEDAYTWKSQPMMFNGRYPAGNVLLSFGVLMAGASISKILLVFKHMGLSAYNARTFFFHQKNFLFPAVCEYWERYQAALIRQVKNLKDVVWSGDGRFDSMGHSAKFGVYSMLCNTILKIVHFELVQANETGGKSPNMELEGAKRAFLHLKSVGLAIKTFISDRHRGIAKWIRETQSGCSHYFDIWHIARSIAKSMIKLGKEKGCEKISDWVKGVRNHLYWCATSTKEGYGGMIAAKWKSFMDHVSNKHDNHTDPLYKKCAHEELEIGDRRWIRIGTTAYNKLHKLLTGTRLVNDIKKLSPDAQTSALEGFHSTLNHFHPKMICFSWLGTFCRHILACLHFNENVVRQTQKTEDGDEYYKVTYPKFKLGEEVVREIAVSPTYGYVGEIRNNLLNMSKETRKTVAEKYNAKVPAPLNSQFPDRVSKAEAVARFVERKEREATKLYPSAEEQDALQASSSSAQPRAKGKRRPGKCHKCGLLVKGHTAEACAEARAASQP